MSNLPYLPEQVDKHFASISTGKGAGPYSGVTDILRNMAIYKGGKGDHMPTSNPSGTFFVSLVLTTSLAAL
eukprot:2931708-Ditylum_brightwellii.AAC.1